MKKYVVWGFGVLLLSMALAQFTTFGYFNHVMNHYLTPMGDGVKLLSLFVFPISLIIIGLEALGSAGFLLLSKDNAIRSACMKMGMAVMGIWVLLVLSLVIRDAPGYAGFFGERMRQTIGWPVLVQSVVFAIWGLLAYRFSVEDDLS